MTDDELRRLLLSELPMRLAMTFAGFGLLVAFVLGVVWYVLAAVR